MNKHHLKSPCFIVLVIFAFCLYGGVSGGIPAQAKEKTMSSRSKMFYDAWIEKPADSERRSSISKETVSNATSLPLTLQESILLGLENNPELLVQRLRPAMSQTSEDQERAQFDPKLSASFFYDKNVSPGMQNKSKSERLSGDLSIDTFLPTGTSIGITQGNNSNVLDSRLMTDNSTRLGLNVTQSLLQGAGTRVNLASLRQARLNTLSSEYELRAYAESFTAAVEKAYWNYYVSRLKVQIFIDSLDLAQKQLMETEERIDIGKLSASELAAAQAELALRRGELINARSSEETYRLRLLRLLNPPGGDFWNLDLQLLDVPTPPPGPLEDVEGFVDGALEKRPDYRQAELAVQRGDLELVKTRNGLLPKLDLFVNLGGTGYARTFADTYGHLNGDYYDAQAGFSFSYPLFNRAARARQRYAELNQEQYELAFANMERLIQEDVRTAFIEVNRSIQQIDATHATRLSQEEKLRSETEKFRVGKSTSLLVAQAQRDFLSSRIDEVQSHSNYAIAVVNLYQMDGSLLDRYGLAADFIEE